MSSEIETKRVFRVKNPDQSLPIPWYWRDSVTGETISAGALNLLVDSVTDYLVKTGRDSGNVESEIHEITGKALITKGHRELVDIYGEVKRTPDQYVSGAKAMLKTWWSESPVYALMKGTLEREKEIFVNQDEGDRRASVCVKCPENVIPIEKSWAQAWTDDRMLESVEDRITKSHDDLGVCGVCTCELRASVWHKPNIVVASMEEGGYENKLPENCWKKKIKNLN